MKIGEHLKSFRISAGFSVKEVSDHLQNCGFTRVSPKTLYSWESDNSQPTPEIFLELCHFYGIQNILFAFGYSHGNEKVEYDSREDELIKKYRRLGEKGRAWVDATLDRELEFIAQAKNTREPELLPYNPDERVSYAAFGQGDMTEEQDMILQRHLQAFERKIREQKKRNKNKGGE